MASADLNFTNLIYKCKREVEEHYDQLIGGLTSRRDSILNALKTLNERFLQMNATYSQSITLLNRMCDESSACFKNNNSIEKRIHGEHIDLYAKQREDMSKMLEDAHVKFEHFICIQDCIKDSGSLKLKGSLVKSIDSLLLDMSVLNLDTSPLDESCSIQAESQVVESLNFNHDYVSYEELHCQSLPANISRERLPILTNPSAVCVDPDTQLVYAVDGGKVAKIFVYNSEAVFMQEILPLLPRRIRGPVSLYGICARKGRLYLSDTHNNIIIAIRATNGEFLASTPAKSHFNRIQNIAVEPKDGFVFACDSAGDSSKIAVFDELLVSQYKFGERFLSKPRDVKIRKDTVIVLDSGEFSLCFFTKEGTLQGHIITHFSRYTPIFGSIFPTGRSSGLQFFDVDEEGNAYITSVNSSCIRKFDLYGGQVSYPVGEDGDKAPFVRGIAVIGKSRVVSICTKTTPDQLQLLAPSK